ncbi:MAG TPA: hypothetical protein VFF68_08605 [Anaerolineaceae bacterium]|nr:hypothetical protein [Anaerolineaceae bacterium]
MERNGTPSEQLTARQRAAIEALLVTPTTQEAAAQVRVGRSTLYRWLRDPSFKSSLREAEQAAVEAASRRLLVMQDQALATFERLLDETVDVPDSVRLRAAQAVLDNFFRLRELQSNEERLSELERLVYGR